MGSAIDLHRTAPASARPSASTCRTSTNRAVDRRRRRASTASTGIIVEATTPLGGRAAAQRLRRLGLRGRRRQVHLVRGQRRGADPAPHHRGARRPGRRPRRAGRRHHRRRRPSSWACRTSPIAGALSTGSDAAIGARVLGQLPRGHHQGAPSTRRPAPATSRRRMPPARSRSPRRRRSLRWCPRCPRRSTARSTG